MIAVVTTVVPTKVLSWRITTSSVAKLQNPLIKIAASRRNLIFYSWLWYNIVYNITQNNVFFCSLVSCKRMFCSFEQRKTDSQFRVGTLRIENCLKNWILVYWKLSEVLKEGVIWQTMSHIVWSKKNMCFLNVYNMR